MRLSHVGWFSAVSVFSCVSSVLSPTYERKKKNRIIGLSFTVTSFAILGDDVTFLYKIEQRN